MVNCVEDIEKKRHWIELKVHENVGVPEHDCFQLVRLIIELAHLCLDRGDVYAISQVRIIP